MKKIYSVSLILLAIWASSVQAQLCPGTASARPIIDAVNGLCYVKVIGAPPGATVALFVGNTPINQPALQADANGNATILYNCNTTPTSVEASGFLNGNPIVCQIPLAPEANLPIKIKSFTAQAQSDNSVLLRWVSVFEANSSKFVIQKSLDGRSFSDVGEVKAAGNSASTLNYTFNDRQLLNGGAYYRLKLMDLDGTVDYTKIVYINNGDVMFTNLSVFPNPFRSEVQLKGVTTADVNRKNIKVYNTMGSEVNYRVVGGNSIIIDPSVPKGVYILRVKGQAYKLFKE
jgi:hypothetical protein